MLAVLFALLSAATFGLTNATARRGVITGTVTQVVGVSMPIGLVMFAAAAVVAGQIGRIADFSPAELGMLAAAGVIHFVLGRYCGYRSMQAMGANLAGLVQQWSLLVTLMFAITVLSERLDVLKLLGIGLLMVGPAMANASSARNRQPGAFKPRLLEGWTFALLSCLFWGSSPVLVRAVVGGTDRALAGGVVSYGAATLVVAFLFLSPAARRDASSMDRESFKWGAWAGVLVCLSQIFHYLALSLAPLTLTQPLMQLQTLFRTLFGWVINRDHEVYSGAVMAALAISLVGAVLVTLNPLAVIEWLDPAPWLERLLRWRWPA